MMINVARIPESGMKIHEEEPGEILGLTGHDECRPSGPVRCDFYVQMVDDALLVRGTVSVSLEVPCARCTQIFSTTVTDSGFLRDFPGLHGTEEIDMTEDIREALLLILPRMPLCGEACRGLCPRCGKNLNDGPCGCREGKGNSPWDELNNLKL